MGLAAGANLIDQVTVGVVEAEKAVTADKNGKIHDVTLSDTVSLVQSQELVFTESEGSAAGVYTGTIQLPAGATIMDIVVQNDALWTADTSASLIVGDTVDPDGWYTAVDLKATDLLADESLSFGVAGGVQGAFIMGTLTHVTDRRKATAALSQVIAEVTTVGTVGTAGITRVIVYYSVGTAVESTFVAT